MCLGFDYRLAYYDELSFLNIVKSATLAIIAKTLSKQHFNFDFVAVFRKILPAKNVYSNFEV